MKRRSASLLRSSSAGRGLCWLLATGVALASLPVACHLVSGVGELQFADTPTGSTTPSSSGGSGIGGSAGSTGGTAATGGAGALGGTGGSGGTTASGGAGGVGGSGGQGGTGGGPLVSCVDQYPAGSPIVQAMDESETECQVCATTVSEDCYAICSAHGGECLNAYNDDNACNIDWGLLEACNHLGSTSIICLCSRGCGDGPACVYPAACSSGVCS